jgi:predicted DNA-binding transcriptional regulator AlpA
VRNDPRHEAAVPTEQLPKLAYRIDEVAKALSVGRRTIEKLRAAGRFPKPDRHIGKCPVWAPQTIAQWVQQRGDDR